MYQANDICNTATKIPAFILKKYIIKAIVQGLSQIIIMLLYRLQVTTGTASISFFLTGLSGR